MRLLIVIVIGHLRGLTFDLAPLLISAAANTSQQKGAWRMADGEMADGRWQMVDGRCDWESTKSYSAFSFRFTDSPTHPFSDSAIQLSGSAQLRRGWRLLRINLLKVDIKLNVPREDILTPCRHIRHFAESGVADHPPPLQPSTLSPYENVQVYVPSMAFTQNRTRPTGKKQKSCPPTNCGQQQQIQFRRMGRWAMTEMIPT